MLMNPLWLIMLNCSVMMHIYSISQCQYRMCSQIGKQWDQLNISSTTAKTLSQPFLNTSMTTKMICLFNNLQTSLHCLLAFIKRLTRDRLYTLLTISTSSRYGTITNCGTKYISICSLKLKANSLTRTNLKKVSLRTSFLNKLIIFRKI